MKPKFLLAFIFVALIVSSASAAQLFRHIKQAFKSLSHQQEKENANQPANDIQKDDQQKDDSDQKANTQRDNNQQDDKDESERSDNKQGKNRRGGDEDDDNYKSGNSRQSDEQGEGNGDIKGSIKKAVLNQLFHKGDNQENDDQGGSLKERIAGKVIDAALNKATSSFGSR